MMTPIYHLFVTELETKIKEECITVAQKHHIEVNEEGLLQALTNARKFYDEGYADGQRDATVKLVYCRDCKHCSTNTPDGLHWCDEHERGCLMDDDFCSYGERRDGDG